MNKINFNLIFIIEGIYIYIYSTYICKICSRFNFGDKKLRKNMNDKWHLWLSIKILPLFLSKIQGSFHIKKNLQWEAIIIWWHSLNFMRISLKHWECIGTNHNNEQNLGWYYLFYLCTTVYTLILSPCIYNSIQLFSLSYSRDSYIHINFMDQYLSIKKLKGIKLFI